MRLFNRILALTILCGFLTVSAFPQDLKDDVIFKAVGDELARSVKDLKWKTFDKPYFLEYKVADIEMLLIQANFGAILNSNLTRRRVLSSLVRVGDYELDSSSGAPSILPLDDDYDAIRRAVWVSTDSAYKRAVNSFESLKAFKERNADETEDEKIASFSKEEPVVSIEKVGRLEVDKSKWETRVRNWSAEFRKYPKFRDATFNFYIRQANDYLINSEGTKIRKPEFLITIDIHASARTKDRIPYSATRHLFTQEYDETLSVERINKEIKSMAEEIDRFEKTPKLEETYIGPAIFTQGAANQLFLDYLVPQIRGSSFRGGGRIRDAAINAAAAAVRRGTISRSGFSDRVGRRVLPRAISVVDDPTMSSFGNANLVGGFDLDDQGVKPIPLNLVENGILKTLLATRSPQKGISKSNGRARGSRAGISNLIIKSKQGKTFDELKADMIADCKEQGLPYGIIFRDYDAVFGTFSSPGTIAAFKVYVDDGREELIKGERLTDFTVRDLRRILAVGDDPFVSSVLIDGSYNGNGTPVSIVAPSVLIEEINLQKSKFIKAKPDIVGNPFSKK